MPVTVIAPPAPVVSDEEIDRHLRGVPAEDVDYVRGLVAAAQGWIDGPAGWLGRAVGVQVLEYRAAASCSPVVRLPYPPIIEVISADIDGEMVPVDHYEPGEPSFSFGSSLTVGEPIRIRYRAGYGKLNNASPPVWVNDVPAPIKVAIMMLVGQWYRAPEAVNIGNIVNEMPFAVEALLQPYRVYA